MGNSNSPPPPPPVQHPIMNSIYNRNANILPPPGRVAPTTTTSQRVPFKLDSYIDKSKLHLTQVSPTSYRIEITFTSQVACQINIHFFAREMTEGESSYMITDSSKYPPSICTNFQAGVNQVFNSAIIDLARYGPGEIFSNNLFSITVEIYPIYYDPRPSVLHRTYCSFARSQHFITLKVVKQAVIFDGKLQVLMDIFGVEKANDENLCTICLCETKNTMILPCRHLCLCYYCAGELGKQRNTLCPICRINVLEFVKIT